jgi:tetratricopeptide (TPR) repeat protein
LLVLAVVRPAGADEPKPPEKPRTPEQRERLRERDRLAAEVPKLLQAGKEAEAVAAWQTKLAIEREVFGTAHPEVAASLARLAGLHEGREDFAAARQALQERLDIQAKLYGEKHWRVTDARLAVADVEQRARMDRAQRRRLAEARQLNEEVGALFQRGRYQQAVPLVQESLAIHKQALGERHPDYAATLNSLAVLYQYQGDYAKAEPLFRQAREITRQALGERHPHYAASLNNLAFLYRDMGDY